MKTIEQLRKEINDIDDEMLELFIRRMSVVSNIAIIKKNLNLPVLDLSREKMIIEGQSNKINSRDLKVYYLDFYQNLIKISKEYQEEIIK